MDTVDRWRIFTSLMAFVVFAALVVFLGLREPEPQPINGDVVGQDTGESFTDYQQRAEASLQALDPASDERHFALVTFDQPLTAEGADTATAPVLRVNAMIFGLAAPRPLPEPVDGATRASVYEREFDRIARGLSGIGEVPVPERMNAVVVWDVPATLFALNDDDLVATVEALPADAAWGLFGIRPVDVPGSDAFASAAYPTDR